jgi:hypothetical protein
LNAFVRRKKQIKFAVCSRSVANQAYLTNYRYKKRKVIMHHTQGVWGSGVFAPGMFAFAQQPGKQAKTGKPRRSRSINKEMAAAPGRNPV